MRALRGPVGVQPGEVVPPSPPPGLLAATRDGWLRFWSSPMAAYVVDSDHPALGRLFELYDELERARRAFRKNRVTTGSMGQMVVSPLALWISRLAAQCVPLEDRFGLNPQARLKLGVQLGEAKRSLEDINRDMAAGEPDDEGVPLEVVDVDAREA